MKFSYSAVWEDTAALVRNNFSLVAALAGAFLFLPALLIGHFLPQPIPAEDPWVYLRELREHMSGNWPWLMLQALANSLGVMAILKLVLARQGTSVGGALGGAAAILPFYFLAGFLANMIVFAGLMLLFVPGLYLFARLVPVGPVMAAEDKRNPLAAIGRAFQVTKGKGWAVLGLVILVAIPGVILVQIVNALFAILFRVAAGEEVARLLTLIVTGITLAALTVLLQLLYAAIYRAFSARGAEARASEAAG